MSIKCIETGEIYPSAAAAARAVSISPGAITHHLKGRQKTAGGYRWEKIATVSKRPQRVTRVIRDDAGAVYRSYNDLANAKGISQNKAYRWVNSAPDRVFRNVWLRESVRRIEFGFDGRRWLIRDIAFAARNDAVRYVRRLAKHFPVIRAHSALDKARRECRTVVMYFGDRGWAEDRGAGDLFDGV